MILQYWWLQVSNIYDNPITFLDTFLNNNPDFLTNYNNNNYIQEDMMIYLQKELRASKSQIHLEFQYRIASDIKSTREKELTASQERRGILQQVYNNNNNNNFTNNIMIIIMIIIIIIIIIII